MKFIKTLGMATVFLAAVTTSATIANEKEANRAIEQKLMTIGLQASEINATNIAGLKEVITDRGIFMFQMMANT